MIQDRKGRIFLSLVALSIIFGVVGQSAIDVAYGYGYGYHGKHHHVKKDEKPQEDKKDVVATPATPQNVSEKPAVSGAQEGISDHSSKKRIAPKKTLKVSARTVRLGGVLVQKGTHFSKNAVIALYFSKASGGYYPPVYVQTNKDGVFTTHYKVTKPSGKYNWYAVDMKSGNKTKKSFYNVIK